MLPMGTVVAACMLVGVLFALRPPFLQVLPVLVHRLIATIVIAAGLWNVLWYALQHLLEFWGIAALISGVLLVLSGLYILQNPRPAVLPKWLHLADKLRIPIVLALFACFLLYAITIYRL